ncbi:MULTISPECIES: response regulator transcription factor [Roseivirga]|jgi:DNA-binding NarL/FixJ family response regulator|uniref:DNA-binding response regulator n=1 Tax=Roseivirga thermotolerans TaxID=1758176 RepID=A0ABQ3I920_9BACT|nr:MULTISPECIES: response regulator transcription factor [Roseivirga]MEC7754838.1 response regulator transcription factor [Bacteroidota bacterium]GHE69101.1 DNA-binding response regulator [Roseivirga thermotolerans]|tara:strand:+ start:1396 stop:2052 length:657 start_codon:yes stop_codon:yes gene_type:complete
MNKSIRLFVADDHPMILEGLVSFLSQIPEFKICGTASNGLLAYEQLKSLEVDILLTDIQMPQLNGIELVERLIAENRDVKVIVLTMFNDVIFVKRLLQLGVMGYVLKDVGKNELRQAIETVYKGGQFYSYEITEIMMSKLRGNGVGFSLKTDLTDREKEILQLILEQKSNREIADQLFISARTVEAHKRNMLEKTGSKNLAGLIIYAIENEIFKKNNS